MTEIDESKNADSIAPFIWISAIVLLVVVLLGSLVYFSLNSWDLRGQFGDMFGVTNSIFSGLAFGALVYTLILQRRELSLQRRELVLTRQELKNQSIAQADHAATALKASRISALGALLQFYGTCYSGGRARLITGDSGNEVERVQKELRALLDSEK